MDNAQLKLEIRNKISWEIGIDEKGIIVDVDNGIVTLSGTVSSFFNKVRVENAVKKILGVRGIVNQISIDIAKHLKRNDKEIAEAAVKAIQSDASLPKDAITVTVEKGTITLNGEVGFDFQRMKAYDNVHSLYGVVNVINALTLKAPIILNAKDIEKQIEREFQRNAVLHAHKITVRVDGKKVYLSGPISSWFEYKEASDAAFSVPGVTDVQNDLRIQR